MRGGWEEMPDPVNGGTMKGNVSNGYARITLLS
jgi:hypothetical protein